MKFLTFLLIAATSASLMAADPLEFQVGAFTFMRPEAWKWIIPTSTMRKAQLEVPGVNREKAEITFFHFGPGQGGGVQANVDRWFGQFQGGPTSQSEVTQGRTRIHYVQAEGTFQSGMPGGPTTPLQNYALLGAILTDAESGDVFVKMTGPKALVQSAAQLFNEIVVQAATTRGNPGLVPQPSEK